MKHYEITIYYVDNTSEKITAFSRSSSDKFNFFPNIDNSLSDTHPGKKVIIEYSGRNSSTYTYNFWRNTYSYLNMWNIYVDNKLMQQRSLDPINKNSTQFSPIHLN